MPRTFTRLAHAEASPGHCVRCPRNEDLIDLGAEDIVPYGVVYLCTVCLGELLNAMSVITAEQHETVVLALRREHEQLEAELAGLRARSNPGTALITETMEEFANGLDALARAAVQRLAAGPAGGGDLPAAAAEPAESGDDDVPVEAAGERLGGDPIVLGADAAAGLLADLGIAGGHVVVPAGSDGADDAAALLYGDGDHAPADGDDDETD